jgi:hypothetical protein
MLGWLGLFCSGVKNKRSNGNSFFAIVGHGADFNQEGAQSLADKVKILQQTNRLGIGLGVGLDVGLSIGLAGFVLFWGKK